MKNKILGLPKAAVIVIGIVITALFLVLMNLVTFWVYGADKRRARRGQWRVPERTLFLLPLLGGSIGALAGMRVFHHKTRHWYFRWGIPAIFLLLFCRFLV